MTYSIIQADLCKNKQDIVSLWDRNLQDVPRERYHWIYENNPAGHATCTLVKDTKKDLVIGSTTLFPRRVRINGKYSVAGIAGDLTVDKTYRTLGPALSLQKEAILACDRGDFDILYGFPNKQSEPVLLKAGYRILGNITRLTLPLRSYYYLKKNMSLPLVTKLMSNAVDIAMRFLSREGTSRVTEGVSLETLSCFDARFDDLWARASSQFQIIGERSSAYLNWRFIQSPHQGYKIVGLVKEQSLQGFMVYHMVDKIAYIDDLLCVDMEKTLNALLVTFLAFQRREGASAVTISFVGDHRLLKKLREYGFSIRRKENSFAIYSPPGSPSLPYLLDEEKWYVMPGDNDI